MRSENTRISGMETVDPSIAVSMAALAQRCDVLGHRLSVVEGQIALLIPGTLEINGHLVVKGNVTETPSA